VPRLGSERDPGQIFGRGKNIALSGYQGSAECGIEEILLVNFPGDDFPGFGPGGAGLVVDSAEVLPRNRLFGRGGADRQAPIEARAEVRDRETYYAELRYAVDRQSRSVASAPDVYDGTDASARSDEGNRDDNWTRDEMATRAADTWT